MMSRTLTTTLLAALLMGGCTWVKTTEDGEAVRLVDAEEAARCREVGNVSASTRDSVMGVDRNADRVGDEIVALARNEAAALGANAIVPSSDIVDGRQTFRALRCPE